MAEATVLVDGIYPVKFSDEDIVNPEEFACYMFGSNPHRMRPWLLHDSGYSVAVVLASNVEDALGEAVDDGRMDRYLVSDEDRKDYPDDEGISFLGNAGEPFDIESLQIVELTMPEFSFCLLYEAGKKQ